MFNFKKLFFIFIALVNFFPTVGKSSEHQKNDLEDTKNDLEDTKNELQDTKNDLQDIKISLNHNEICTAKCEINLSNEKIINFFINKKNNRSVKCGPFYLFCSKMNNVSMYFNIIADIKPICSVKRDCSNLYIDGLFSSVYVERDFYYKYNSKYGKDFLADKSMNKSFSEIVKVLFPGELVSVSAQDGLFYFFDDDNTEEFNDNCLVDGKIITSTLDLNMPDSLCFSSSCCKVKNINLTNWRIALRPNPRH